MFNVEIVLVLELNLELDLDLGPDLELDNYKNILNKILNKPKMAYSLVRDGLK